MIAVISVLLAVSAAEAGRRPRYGGVVRVEIPAAPRTLDPAEWPAEASEAGAKENLANQVFETLVQVDERGKVQPLLAISWTHEPAKRRWIFTTRPNVALHDGSLWQPSGGTINVPDDRPIEEILRDLAKPQKAIIVRTTHGTLLGTGPFRIMRWEGGKAATLAAHESYWGGRPFLDAVEIQMGRSWRERTLDFELGRADIIEVPLNEVRHLKQQGGQVTLSSPIITLALELDPARAPKGVRERLSLAIDRNAIQTVLLQKQGEVSGALLPQWLSGYAFLFRAEGNPAQPRPAGSMPVTLSFAYDHSDPLMKLIAERITVNAAEAGIALRQASAANSDVRLTKFRIGATDPRQALEDVARGRNLQLPIPSDAGPEALYEAERSVLDRAGILPLLHLPEAHQLSRKVRNWTGSRSMTIDQWRFADVWLDEGARR